VSGLLHDLVSRQARARPDAVAVTSEGGALTYGELDALSARLASVLVDRGVGPGSRVCLLLPKSTWAIVSMVGTLKAGACYVPLDPDSPVPRLRRMVEACDDRWMLASPSTARTAARLMESTPSTGRWVVGWMAPAGATARRDSGAGGARSPGGAHAGGPADGRAESFSLHDVLNAPALASERRVGDDAYAYIMFTSGSTGVPKGVTITHRNVRTFLDWAIEYFRMRPHERISSHPPLHFDLSVFDVFGALVAGAELHLVPPRLNLHAPSLAAFIRDAELTQWFSVPSVLNYMMKTDCVAHGDFPAMKRMIWCGEVLPTPTLIHFMERLPHVRFTNLYGPTETTIASSYYTLPGVPDDPRTPVPIGVACPGESLLVLDASLQPVENGQVGDLYIAGAGLSPGYWRDPDKTDAAFVRRASADGGGARLYRTGDLARVGPGGQIDYVGRSDTQIKSRGYRIELGEIEAALHSLEELEESAVVAVPADGFEGWTICCAYVPRSVADPATLTRRLREWIPGYMVPQRWLHYERLPKNPNGKIDRPRLKEDFEAAPVHAG
jgi:amino acid adenylation domain-containing protein